MSAPSAVGVNNNNSYATQPQTLADAIQTQNINVIDNFIKRNRGSLGPKELNLQLSLLCQCVHPLAYEISELLLATCNVNPNELTQNRTTAFTVVCQQMDRSSDPEGSKMQLLRLLMVLATKEGLNQADSHGKTPLDYLQAKSHINIEAVNLLKKQGAIEKTK